MAFLNFDANTVEPSSDFEPIPAGKYLAVITDSEMKPTKSGTGSYLELKIQVIDGPHKGRNLWSRLNLDNPSAVAVQIAKGELSAICRSVGVLTPQDSSELHDRPLVITVSQRTDPEGNIRNEIRGYAKGQKTAGQFQSAAPAQNDCPF